MDVRSRVTAISAVTFPPDDLVFAARVRGILDDSVRSDPRTLAATLEARLRTIHPHVSTSVRDDLAGFGQPMLYVFRDGSARSVSSTDDWIDDPSTARVVTDGEGTVLEANEAALALFGVTRERIIGAHLDSFTPEEARISNVDEVRRALMARGRLHSFSLVECGNGEEIKTEFVSLRDGAGPGRTVTILRPVHAD